MNKDAIRNYDVEELITEEETYCECGHCIDRNHEVSPLNYCVMCKADELGLKNCTVLVVSKDENGMITDVRSAWVH